ncbi:uncharacterized protein RMCC_0591 [Mycolicibacterium canariasense]|uniref:Transmembrane protein n=2 Tax=Mycolicibacterium canariasense TaxID=228230 RepID=A0A100W8T5_MYCCR|nr:hypothetical protein [Mycolicibacterium canariasense]MCV7213334.1 hypothetical protein [Mycolicibacterium canariasense]ORV10642.1 hypothetical protein AWB94_06650 [Mycolicibacterium canariasense]GAS93625.1 uncharacterized protein RMCC_0591 [Mycolicibacterium canariasense]
MSTASSPAAATRAFARVLGPFFAIVAVTVTARSWDMKRLLDDFESTPVWSWVVGAFVLLAGLVVVSLHPYWHGFAAIVVSLLGWMMVVRGILLLAFPAVFATIAEHTIGAETLWRIVFVLVGVLGLYLALIGWMPQRPSAGSTR